MAIKNSLYGAGMFPFSIYIKYFGKPVYKKARKLGANTYFSLMAANILGSLIHVAFFINGTPIMILWFIGSLILCTSLFFKLHKQNITVRQYYSTPILQYANITTMEKRKNEKFKKHRY